MSITINDQFQNNSGKSLDSKTGKIVLGKTVPYNSVAEANALIPSAYRYQGLEVLVMEGGNAVTYMYRDGIGDGNLVFASAVNTPLYHDTATGKIAITQAGSSSSGYLSATDWNTFNEQTAFAAADYTGSGIVPDPYVIARDTAPVSGSNKPITSDAVYLAIQNLQNQINSLTTTTTTLP